ncbi:MAG: HAD-IA family hydrolase [Burkholderiales bacterium]
MPSAAVLFDFDGTLADTAADLGRALNRMRRSRGLPDVPVEQVRPHASAGARGLLQAGFGVLPEHPEFKPMREEFLGHYDETVCVDTRLFPGISELLAELESRRVPWGIVTNKATRFTRRIVAALGLETRVACVVCGDTTPYIKPHPAPLLRAAEELRLPAAACCYVGDDLRDVQAARAAGMRVVAVEYGYCGTGNDGPRSWNADAVIAHPSALIGCL